MRDEQLKAEIIRVWTADYAVYSAQDMAGAQPSGHRRDRCTLEWLMRELGICVLVHPPSASSAIKFNRQTEGSFVRVRPTVGLSATGSQWRHTREKPTINDLGEVSDETYPYRTTEGPGRTPVA